MKGWIIELLAWALATAVFWLVIWVVKQVLRLPRPWGWVVLGLIVLVVAAWVVAPALKRRKGRR